MSEELKTTNEESQLPIVGKEAVNQESDSSPDEPLKEKPEEEPKKSTAVEAVKRSMF